MKGKVLKQAHLNEIMDRLFIQETETKKIIVCTVDRLEENYIGRTVSLYTTVTEIANSDFDHIYPEGTIGTF